MSFVLKVFYEEPVALEALVPDGDPDARRRGAMPGSLEALLAAPRYARAYLCGTDLEGPRTGLTVLPPAAFVPLLTRLLGPSLYACRGGEIVVLDASMLADALVDPNVTAISAGSTAPDAALMALAVLLERRHGLPALRALLDAHATILLPEPAPDGRDLALFSPAPICARLRSTLAGLSTPGVRRFLAPFQRARGEHAFYFERWALDPPPTWAEEV